MKSGLTTSSPSPSNNWNTRSILHHQQRSERLSHQLERLWPPCSAMLRVSSSCHLPKGQTVNGAYYVALLRQLHDKIRIQEKYEAEKWSAFPSGHCASAPVQKSVIAMATIYPSSPQAKRSWDLGQPREGLLCNWNKILSISLPKLYQCGSGKYMIWKSLGSFDARFRTYQSPRVVQCLSIGITFDTALRFCLYWCRFHQLEGNACCHDF